VITDKQLAQAIGLPINCITPRRGELVECGCVEKFCHEEQENHRMAILWRAKKDNIKYKKIHKTNAERQKRLTSYK
jgi:hypothetical protein